MYFLSLSLSLFLSFFHILYSYLLHSIFLSLYFFTIPHSRSLSLCLSFFHILYCFLLLSFYLSFSLFLYYPSFLLSISLSFFLSLSLSLFHTLSFLLSLFLSLSLSHKKVFSRPARKGAAPQTRTCLPACPRLVTAYWVFDS